MARTTSKRAKRAPASADDLLPPWAGLLVTPRCGFCKAPMALHVHSWPTGVARALEFLCSANPKHPQ